MLFAFILLLQLVPYNVQGKHFLVKTDDDSSNDYSSNEGCFTMNTSPNVTGCAQNYDPIGVLIGDKWTTVGELPADQRKKFEECFLKNKDVAPPLDPNADPCDDPCCSCDEEGMMICS